MFPRTCSLVGLVCLFSFTTAVGAQPTYTVTELAPFFVRDIASPYAVGENLSTNEPTRLDLRTGQPFILEHANLGASVLTVLPTGEAVGLLNLPFNGASISVATAWNAAGQATTLPSGGPSVATSRNAAGIVAAFDGSCANNQLQAIRWIPAQGTAVRLGWVDKGTPRRRLTTLAPQGTETPVALVDCISDLGIDDAGNIWATAAGRVTVYHLDGTVTDLGPGQFTAVAPNGMATMTTFSSAGGTVFRGSLTTPWAPLPNLPSPFAPRPLLVCESRAITLGGIVVGGCADSQNLILATLWGADGVPVQLDTQATFPTNFEQVALAIDEAGDLVVQIGTTGQNPIHRTILLTPSMPRVAQCGNGVAHCQCGDTVVANYNMVAHLACAVVGTEAALVIAPGVMLDGGGQFAVIGTGDGTGVLLDQVEGATVQHVAVTGFHAGLKLRSGARMNLLMGVSAWDNAISLFLDSGNGNAITASQFYGDGGVAMQLVDSHRNIFTQTCKTGQVVLQNSEPKQTKRLPECPQPTTGVASR